MKTEGGGCYIDGAPALRWGEWRDNTYCGCIAAVPEMLGAPVRYETLMGVSGLCVPNIAVLWHFRTGVKIRLDAKPIAISTCKTPLLRIRKAGTYIKPANDFFTKGAVCPFVNLFKLAGPFVCWPLFHTTRSPPKCQSHS